MALDRQTLEFLNQINAQARAQSGDMLRLDVQTARVGSRAMWLAFAGAEDGTCLAEDLHITGGAGKVPARLYRRDDASRHSAPLVVFFHRRSTSTPPGSKMEWRR